ncbi:MAG TPA: glycosyltransferase family 9 protein [Gemmataceae bacterium]|nr:glycosyltransferase family 9 protein [Gemmataceae bacterium]
MRVGILKPDHLGDFVLAAPAVAALLRRFPDALLFCHPATAPLARHLFPGLRLQTILLPHLDRDRNTDPDALPVESLRDSVDLLVCLRWDRHIARLVEASGLDYRGSGLDVLDLHVAAEQRAVVAPLTGPYDLLDSYRYPGAPPEHRPTKPAAVGLCISAGFPLNTWPLNHWLDLAGRLHRRGMEVVLIGGPAEAARLHALAGAAGEALGYRPRRIVGGPDFGAFLDALAGVDLVLATDSGTAHLASLVRPVLSLFGGSPWRRFAPLGRHNAVVTRDYPCSPCRQFDRTTVNGCVGRECLTNLFPAQVGAALDAYLAGEGKVEGARLARAPWDDPGNERYLRRIAAGAGAVTR